MRCVTDMLLGRKFRGASVPSKLQVLLAVTLLAAGSASAECENDTGGMFGFGWDGFGEGSASLYWHVEGWTPDADASGQREQIIQALQAWSDVVQISFQEVPVADLDQSIDLNFVSGDHSAVEAAESGDANCPFGAAPSAHAKGPPSALFYTSCGGLPSESFAGNVHLNEAIEWEDDTGDEGKDDSWSLKYTVAHEVGHALGLKHSSNAFDVMYCAGYDVFYWSGLSADDIESIHDGYAAGSGAVQTLEDIGVFVDSTPAVPGTQWGTSAYPFDTVQEGVDGVPPFATGVNVNIQSGSYPGAVAIESGPTGRTMTLRAVGGTVTIGL